LQNKKLLAEKFSEFCRTFPTLGKCARDFAEQKTFGGKVLGFLQNFSAFGQMCSGFCRTKNFWRKSSRSFVELFRLCGKSQGKFFLVSAKSTLFSVFFFEFLSFSNGQRLNFRQAKTFGRVAEK
jgi:hypothetical protein